MCHGNQTANKVMFLPSIGPDAALRQSVKITVCPKAFKYREYRELAKDLDPDVKSNFGVIFASDVGSSG